MTNGYGLCLNEWLENENIKTELRLLIKISSLTAEKGFCYASNDYFAKYFNTTDVTISKQIKKLEKLDYITIEYKRRGAEIVNREIRLKKTLTDDYQKLKPTIKENFKENNTSINNINNNTSLSKETKQNTKADIFERFINYLKSKCKYKSKVTKTKEGKLLFNQIEDKKQLAIDYIKHQEDKNEFAVRISKFMEDYNTVYKDKTNSNIDDKEWSDGAIRCDPNEYR